MAWLGFTLPSVIALVLFAFLLQGFDISSTGWIHGLKIVAVAIVAQAILGMGQKLTSDRYRATIAIFTAVATLVWQNAFTPILFIVIAGIIGMIHFRKMTGIKTTDLSIPVSRNLAIFCLATFFGILILLPLLTPFDRSGWLLFFDSFYRSGSLVFGGGHVILPLLEREFVPTDLINKSDFLAGYGAKTSCTRTIVHLCRLFRSDDAWGSRCFGCNDCYLFASVPSDRRRIALLEFFMQKLENSRSINRN